MRGRLLVTSCLVLAACSKSPDDHTSRSDEGSAPTYEVAPHDSSPPAVAVTAAPGVAFAYNYNFRLPAERVGAAQEAHAQACEKLGIARCRITGMQYRLAGENDVQAELTFKLDPGVARAFGKQAIDVVRGANGQLIEAAITGTDAGAELDRLAVERARAADDQRRVDGELAKNGRSGAERSSLQAERAEIARRRAAIDAAAADQRGSLATTPMTFGYHSSPAITGFDASAPIRSAASMAIGSAQITLGALLGVIAIAGPPAIVLLLLWMLWRRFGRVVRRRAAEALPA